MKVFLSWSGELSKSIALTLRDWLPQVIQGMKPWLSTMDIPKGSPWTYELARELRDSQAAIFCVTPDNHTEQWLNFEAGAVSNKANTDPNANWTTRVCTYLFEMKPSDITGPMSQFQHTLCEKEETFSLIKTLNGAQGENALQERILQKSFDTYWPELEIALDSIRKTMPRSKAVKRSIEDMVEETLNIARGLQMRDVSSVYAYVGDYPPLENYNHLIALKELVSKSHEGPVKTATEVRGFTVKGSGRDNKS